MIKLTTKTGYLNFKDWWDSVGLRSIPNGEEPPEHGAIAELAWYAPKEVTEIKDFGKPGDEIKVEFTNDKGEKRMHVLRVTANGKVVMG